MAKIKLYILSFREFNFRTGLIDENDIFTATVLDTYRKMVEETDVQNGDILYFPRVCVMEIPHTWENNENLVILESMTTGNGREVTGIL